jgi:hypothetical protein
MSVEAQPWRLGTVALDAVRVDDDRARDVTEAGFAPRRVSTASLYGGKASAVTISRP